MNGNRRKRLILRVLAAVAVFFYVLHPTIGLGQVSTVDGAMSNCAKDAACASTLSSLAPDVLTLAPTAANNIVPFSLAAPAGVPASLVPASVPAAVPAGGFPWGAVVPLAAGGSLLYPWGKDQADNLQKKANERCTADPAYCQLPTTGLWDVTLTYNYYGSPAPSQVYRSVPAPFVHQPQPGYPGNYYFFYGSGNYYGFVNGQYLGNTEGVTNVKISVTPIDDVAKNQPPPGGQLTPDLIPGALADTKPVYMPPGTVLDPGSPNAPIIELTPGQNGQATPNPQRRFGPYTSPGSNPGTDPNKDTDGDGVPDWADPDIDGDGLPNWSDPDMDSDGVPNSDDPDFPPNKPQPGTEVTGDVPASVSPAQFTKPNFLQYGWQVFSNKFPLDIIGTPPQDPGASVCPTLTFWGKPFELCIVLHFIQALQVPVIISFLIWAVLVL